MSNGQYMFALQLRLANLRPTVLPLQVVKFQSKTQENKRTSCLEYLVNMSAPTVFSCVGLNN